MEQQFKKVKSSEFCVSIFDGTHDSPKYQNNGFPLVTSKCLLDNKIDSSIASLISNASSRRDEFQADRYSRDMCGSGTPLSTALIKLNKENLSEIVPPKIYSAFNYSHPPLLERIRAVDGLND